LLQQDETLKDALNLALKDEAIACSKAGTSTEPCPIGATAKKNYALIKDCGPTKPHGYLVIPTESVSGIEATAFGDDKYAQIWADAWEWSQRFPDAQHSWTGVAINSPRARDIDQLHIHLSCVQSNVRDSLESKRDQIRDYDGKKAQHEIPFPIVGDYYHVVRVRNLTGVNNPLTVMKTLSSHWSAEESPTCKNKDARNGCSVDVAVIGTSSGDGYYILTYESGPGNGSAELLLDQYCENFTKDYQRLIQPEKAAKQ
jgi:CDP-diacylglycerol pyrophosphatase